MRRRAARNRSKTRRGLRKRYGSGRPISPITVSLCLDRLEAAGVSLTVRGKSELFYFLQRILHTKREGAALPLSRFSSKGVGRKLVRSMLSEGLAHCPDPNSWKPRDCDFRNAKARRFLPSAELLLANRGCETVASAAEYFSAKHAQRRRRHRSEVILHSASPVKLSEHCIQALRRGTGLTFNVEKALPLLNGCDAIERVSLLQSMFGAVGYNTDQRPIHTRWKQEATGRLYASRPAILNLPKDLRAALEPMDKGLICEIDYRNFESRIVHSEAGIETPAHDYTAYLGEQLGSPPAEVKAVLNPLLHGQTPGNLVAKRMWDRHGLTILLQEFLRQRFPAVWKVIEGLQHDKYLLQRRGAEVFFAAYDEALQIEGIPAGIPLHDGWVFPARDEAQMFRVRAIFEKIGTEKLAQPMPVKTTIISNS